ncbi:MAG: Smr/MutS family protein [Rhodocyclaceae bacterium]|nr:Smr/MutS family protein [Rhodocyclaceae bacterium]
MADVRPLPDRNRVDPLPPTRSSGAGSVPRPSPDRPPDDSSPPEAWLDWAQAGATPLKDSGRVAVDKPKPTPHPLQRELDDASVLRESIETPLSFEDRLDIGDEAVFLRTGLPRRVLSDLRRGRWVVQRELDLHGLTRDEARQALATFLAACLNDGKRCVRLIHGKGLGSPGGVGILKQLSRGWLAQREEVLAFCQARPHEGGSGALLILMRSGKARSGGTGETAGAT